MNYAWVTLTTNDDYIIGVEALAYSLQHVQSKYPLIVLITKKITDEGKQRLQKLTPFVHEIPSLYPDKTADIKYIRPEFEEAWTKLRIWEMIDYHKLTFLDADMLVIQNMDDIFEIQGDFGAVQTCICNPQKIATYPQHWKPDNCPYTENGKENPHPQGRYFNAGLLVVTPSLATFEKLKHAMNTWDVVNYAFAEQDFLNIYYTNWSSVPFEYNALKTFSKSHPEIWDLKKIKNIHYIIAKPWDTDHPANKDYESLNKLWWNIYLEGSQKNAA